MKKEINLSELVESHKPKYFKYKYIFKDPEILNKLDEAGYDTTTLDTIQNAALCEAALQAEFQTYERDVIGKAKQPSILENGIILCKKMITKADKKLYHVQLGFFTYNNIEYVCVKFEYELFDIIEIYVMI